MTKILVCFFSMALVSLFLICDWGHAQDMPTPGGVSSYQGVDRKGKPPYTGRRTNNPSANEGVPLWILTHF